MIVYKPENYHRTPDNVRQEIELCPTKAASKWTHLSIVKLNNVNKLVLQVNDILILRSIR